MTYWMRLPDRDRSGERDRFEPIAEGERHGLRPDIAQQLWDRICAERVDGAPRGDTEAGRQRFRDVAPRLAARRRRSQLAVGKTTSVLAELAGEPRGHSTVTADLDAELVPRAPGRATQVDAMIQQQDRMYGPQGMDARGDRLHEDPAALGNATSATAADEPPGAAEVRQVLAALQQPWRSASPEPAEPVHATRPQDAASLRTPARLDQLWRVPEKRPNARPPAAAPSAAQPSQEAPRNPTTAQTSRGRGPVLGATRAAPVRPGPAVSLEPAVAARMSRLFGVDLTRTAVVPDSPAATGATKAVTKDGEVHFRAGAYQPNTPEGDRLIAHELAHIVQLRGDGDATRRVVYIRCRPRVQSRKPRRRISISTQTVLGSQGNAFQLPPNVTWSERSRWSMLG
jgi:hypothetical protein